jgi:hypothetical protein
MKVSVQNLPYIGVILALAMFVLPSFNIPSFALGIYALVVVVVFVMFPIIYIMEKGSD